MDSLRGQEEPQDRIESSVYFVPNAIARDHRCILRAILQTSQFESACA
jgi:hypothetical protein